MSLQAIDPARPMLCVPATIAEAQQRVGVLVQRKFDGVRAMLLGGRLWTRHGRDVTDRFPDALKVLFDSLDSDPAGLVLDGEIVAHRGGFEDVVSRLNGGREAVACDYVPFDLLADRHRDLRDWTLSERVETLYSLGIPCAQDLCDPLESWRMARAERWEGIVVKDLSSPYVPTRSRHWLKVRFRFAVTCVVTGIDKGTGSRGPVGALLLSLIDDAWGIRYVGRVGSGFSEQELAQVQVRAGAGQPFAVDVECSGLTGSGRLRNPVFLRFRDDVEPSACTYRQLADIERKDA